MGSDFKVELSADIDALRDDWSHLEAEGDCSPYQSQLYIKSWFKTVGRACNASPLFLLVRDKKNESLIFLLPLCVRSRSGMRCAEFIDVSYGNGPLLSRNFKFSEGDIQSIWHQFIKALNRVDLVDLRYLSERVGQSANPLMLLRGAKPLPGPQYVLHLPKKWDTYYNALSKNFRRNIKRSRATLDRIGAVQFKLIDHSDVDNMSGLLDRWQLMRLNQKGASSQLKNEPVLEHFRLFQQVGTATGRAVVSCLMLDGQPIAGMSGIKMNGSVTMMRVANVQDPVLHKAGLGRLVYYYTIEELFNCGYREISLCIGDYDYKKWFRADQERQFEITQALSLRGNVALLGHGVKNKIRTLRRAA